LGIIGVEIFAGECPSHHATKCLSFDCTIGYICNYIGNMQRTSKTQAFSVGCAVQKESVC